MSGLRYLFAVFAGLSILGAALVGVGTIADSDELWTIIDPATVTIFLASAGTFLYALAQSR